MFSVDKGDETACTIGVPNRASVASLQNVKSIGTYIGGQAVWNDDSTAPKEGSIKCGNCGDSSKMVLVSQIYAPIESDRTLYVFCCNSRVCSLLSSGWVVVRNQEGSKEAIMPAKAESTSVWGDFLAPTPEEVGPGKNASAWGDFSFEDESADASVDALTALLQERDLLLNAKTEKKVTTAAKANTSSASSRYTTAQQLPCWEVSELEESWAAVDEEAAWEGLGAEEDGAAGGAADEHISRLLKSYYEGEEDTEIVNIVKKQQQGGAQKGVSEVAPPVATEKSSGPVKKAPAAKKQASRRADDSDGESSDGEGAEAGLSRSSRRQQVEAYFQHRVSFYPTQVLRYAYGGAPLWISHPNPLDAPLPATAVSSHAQSTTATVDETVFQLAETKKSKKNKSAPLAGSKKASAADEPPSHIPRCEGCGKTRVFECQLMPALLSYISTTSSASKEVPVVKESAWNLDNPPTAADILRFQETLGDELDFGVVAIYSCPDSCANCTEYAVVQGPPDIL